MDDKIVKWLDVIQGNSFDLFWGISSLVNEVEGGRSEQGH